MKRALAITFVLTLLSASSAVAQQTVLDAGAPSPSNWDLAAGYDLVNANAPPASCGCFTMNGGFVAGEYHLSPWLGAAGEVTAGHASTISSLGQNLTLATFMAGPRVSWVHDRYTPFGEFMLGGARGTGSYFPSSTSSSSSAATFAYSTGGGLDVNLSDRFAVRVVDAQFLHTGFPNGVNGTQRQLQIGVGVVMRFGGSKTVAHLRVPRSLMKQPPEVALSCTATDPEVAAGQNVQIIANAVVAPDPAELRYTWTAGAGTVRGQGSTVAIDTTNLAPGTYHVQGIAALVSNSSIDSSCEVSFRVNSAQAKTPDRTMPTKFAPPSESSFDDGARGHLKDAFFDYDKSDLRPDASSAMAQDAAYLVAHPAVSITLAGYSDERGSAEYNIALGLERAIAARDALASLGVPMSRMHVISYGKELSFCSDETENCYQLNRRAQLVLTDE